MIIGIAGTLGSGKGMAAEYLAKKHNFTYLSVRNFFAQEVLRRGKMVTRDAIAQVALELRAQYGKTHAVEQLVGRIIVGKNIVIESIRTKEEAGYLQEKGALLWAVDADPQVRYQRILQRDASTENVSFEQSIEKEMKEGVLTEVISMADAVLQNNGTKEEFFAAIDSALTKVVPKA